MTRSQINAGPSRKLPEDYPVEGAPSGKVVLVPANPLALPACAFD